MRCNTLGAAALSALLAIPLTVLSPALEGSISRGARAATFVLDRDHTEVRFTWDHLGISRQSGRIVDVTGTLDFDEERPEAAKVSAIMKVASLWTGAAALDALLVKTRDYFNVQAHPTITFESTEVRPTGSRTAEISGDLTINGVARPVVLQATWNFGGEHPLAKINPVFTGQYVAGFSAVGEIRRSDWGISRFAPYVSDEIRIAIEAEFKRPLEASAAE